MQRQRERGRHNNWDTHCRQDAHLSAFSVGTGNHLSLGVLRATAFLQSAEHRHRPMHAAGEFPPIGYFGYSSVGDGVWY